MAKAGFFEIIAARIWNILNEGKSFLIVFSLFVLIIRFLLGIQFESTSFLYAILLALPLLIIFVIYDFPLKYRSLLWLLLMIFFIYSGFFDLITSLLVILLYFAFTVLFWGTIYYHIRTGITLLNFTRFWKLVLENSDSTSGNSMEQLPKLLIITNFFFYIYYNGIGNQNAVFVSSFIILTLMFGILSKYLFFKKIPFKETGKKTKIINKKKKLTSKIYIIVIDGCRQDKFHEAKTPNIDLLRKNGVEFTKMRTVYPARTVVCFSSMFSGAPKEVHGVKSNLVLRSLLGHEGLKCESVFDVMKKDKMSVKLIGIAHLKDCFGDDVRAISAIHDNETVDQYIMNQTKKLIEEENPDLIVTQLISTDQTGHARGTSYPEYVEKIEKVDELMGDFITYLKKKKLFKNSTLIIMADHGQSYRGIGGHGHWDKGEKYVPFVISGKGVKKGLTINKQRRILDLAPTIAYLLKIPPPSNSIGETLTEAINKK